MMMHRITSNIPHIINRTTRRPLLLTLSQSLPQPPTHTPLLTTLTRPLSSTATHQRTILSPQIPTCHSRKIPLPPANPSILTQLTSSLLSSPVGSWYTLPPSSPASHLGRDYADDISDTWSQKVEHAIRGHARFIEGSLVHRREGEPTELADDDDELSIFERCLVMKSLIDRIEQEGASYRDAQVTAINTFLDQRDELEKKRREENPLYDTSQYDETATAEEKKEREEAERTLREERRSATTKTFCGATPGVTIGMIDVTLDALALSRDPEAIDVAQELLNYAILRHVRDGGYENTNPKTIPTALTYNGVIRTVANVNYDGSDLRVRDEGIAAAFLTFNKMFRSDVVDRNAATFRYIIQVLNKFIPESRSRGNMCAGIYVLAKGEMVVDEAFLKEMQSVSGGGKEYRKLVEGLAEMEKIPHRWRKMAPRRRYKGGYDLY